MKLMLNGEELDVNVVRSPHSGDDWLEISTPIGYEVKLRFPASQHFVAYPIEVITDQSLKLMRETP